MNKIKLLNKIAAVGTDNFDKSKYTVGENVDAPDAIMVRSADMLSMEMNPELKAIARAGAGVNNIPVDKCAEQGIVVFNTPGANANGVKELAIAAMLLAARDIIGGIEWVKENSSDENIEKTVEKAKSKFAGTELKGKTLGVIGLGAIGGLVANAAVHLGMNVIGFDPYLSVDAAWLLSRSIIKASSYDDIYEKSDYITLHIPATDETKGMFNSSVFAKMNDGVRIINFSRAGLVNSGDIKEALSSGKIAAYVTDFPTPDIAGVPGIICIPHLGASTEESEDNCAVMAALQLIEFLENGNIKNSVNYPDVSMPHSGDKRICVMHRNIPNLISHLSAALGADNINIENMFSRSKKDFAYSIFEINGELPEEVIEKLRSVTGVIRVNIY
ncbi:MAG: 3-phosphoglycerate dehydrogenase [Clostridiales bacterium]|jgi:D-3-phosphoglycerate dehydrogenase|nr:3-phosphoglycerate dehydrogenase [Clostridiales bacterium]